MNIKESIKNIVKRNIYVYKTALKIIIVAKKVKSNISFPFKFFRKVFDVLAQNISYTFYHGLSRRRFFTNIDIKTTTRIDYLSFRDSRNKKRLLLSAVKLIVRAQLRIDLPNQTDTLFIKSMIRPDYNIFFERVYNQWPGEKAKTDIEFRMGDQFLVVRLLKLLLYLPVFIKVYETGFYVSFYRYLRAVTYLSVLQNMHKCQIRNLVAFADMQGVENMLVQYFKSKGAQTITLQHGLYVDYSSYENINKVNYENVVSDHFLAWGNETRELIQKYHPSVKITVCGKPIDLTPPKEKEHHFTLVFDQNIFKEQNRELIAIANEIARHTGLQINVRLHPWNNKAEYEFDEEICVFDRSIEASQFVLGHTTSMIFECMRSGIPAYKYRTEIPANVIDERLKFSDADELMQCLENTKDFDFVEAGKYYLQYVGEESLEQYRRFFDRLMEDSMYNQIH
ncbi:MAG TPA: hypothetical protein P5228_07400 [Bacteroidales bacterium]|nr:hypothetical protein [Bacteroidales bacterium]HRZ48690.1 hypothetical protein [Bacteroidales bacterium]